MDRPAPTPPLSRRSFALGGAALLGAAVTAPLTRTAHAAVPPGGEWADVPVPPLAGRSQLFGIAAPDPWHVFTGGTENASTPEARAVMLHRGLRGWTRAALPEGLSVVNDVRARHAADAWAVAAGPNAQERTDLLRWNGFRWTTTPAPDGERLHAIDVDRTGGLWATGAGEGGGTVSVRRHGRWTNTLTLPGTSLLSAIAAGDHRDVWVGGYGGSSGQTPLWHWDGTSWTRVLWGTPYSHWIVQIEYVSPDDVWFYALEQHPLFPPPTLHHWNGSGFTVHPIPGPSTPLGGVSPRSAVGFLGSIASDGRRGVWVSSPYDTSGLLHFDGTSWTRVAPPLRATAYAMTRVPYTGTIWAGTQIGTVWRHSKWPTPHTT